MHDVIHAHGYRLGSEPARGLCPSGADVVLTMQFGHEVAFAGTVPTLPLMLTLELRGDAPAGTINRWTTQKVFSSAGAGGDLRLSVVGDVRIAGHASPARLQKWTGRLGHSHLEALISDARESLADLPIGRCTGSACAWKSPVVRVEARAIGDLLSGRSGLLKSALPAFDAAAVALRIQACDLLTLKVLPDVVHLVNAISLAESSIGHVTSPNERAGLENEHVGAARKRARSTHQLVTHRSLEGD